jgi:signal transduction histidine kinase
MPSMLILIILILFSILAVVFLGKKLLTPEKHTESFHPSYLADKIWYESELNFLFEFDKKLISAVKAEDVIKCITEAAHNFLPIERTVLLSWDKNSGTFTPACAIGWQFDGSGSDALGKDSIAGFVLKNREMLVVSDLSQNQYLNRLKKENFLQKAFICAPLIYKEEFLGVVFVCDKKTAGPFAEREVSVLAQIARNGAITLQNVRMYEQALERAAELKLAYDELTVMQDKLIQSEKLKAIGQLASGVAHEMRNPIGTIMQGVAYLEQIIPAEQKEPRETVSIIRESAQRADRIVISLLDFSRPAKLELRPEDIASVIEDSINLVKAELKQIEVLRDIQHGLPRVSVDKNKLMQVFINLFVNSVHAMPDGGRLYVRVFYRDLSVVAEVEDEGQGIPAENLQRIFDPFFTTKAPGKGTGLGLSICRNIIMMHGGSIKVASQPGKGTIVTVVLKAAG